MAHRDDLDRYRLSAAYALDALDNEERAAFEAAYVSEEDASADVLDLREVAALLAVSQAAPPPAHLRADVLAEVARTRQHAPRLPNGVADLTARRRRTSTAVLAVAAALLLIVGSAVLLRAGSGDPAFADQLADVLAEPDSRMVMLPATDGAPGEGSVRVVWSARAERAVVLGDGLAVPPGGQAYELWLIDGEGPIPMRLLDAAEGGSIRAVVDLLGPPVAWGVTIEPSTGSPAPTGDILYLAEV